MVSTADNLKKANYFLEPRQGEVLRITRPGTWVNKGNEKGRETIVYPTALCTTDGSVVATISTPSADLSAVLRGL
jgi:hypothetical protein